MQTACILTRTYSRRLASRHNLCLSLAVIVLLCGSSDVLRAGQISDSTESIRSSTALVRVDVSVLDKHGTLVPNLQRSDFRVLDNGNQATIVSFAPIEARAQVLVLIETSPAVYLIQDEHFAAAYALLQGLAPDDEVAMVSYDEKPRLRLPFSSNKTAFLHALDGLQYIIGMGQLNFYDSLARVIDWLPPGGNKQAVVALTTGLDSSTTEHWDALMRKLRGSDVVVFPVALGASLRGGSGKESKRRLGEPSDGSGQEAMNSSEASFERADDGLWSLAKVTGGQAFFPESAKDFATAYRQIAAALRHQYVLGIAAASDGQVHSLTVEIAGREAARAKNSTKAEYRIFAREGYLAPSP